MNHSINQDYHHGHPFPFIGTSILKSPQFCWGRTFERHATSLARHNTFVSTVSVLSVNSLGPTVHGLRFFEVRVRAGEWGGSGWVGVMANIATGNYFVDKL